MTWYRVRVRLCLDLLQPVALDFSGGGWIIAVCTGVHEFFPVYQSSCEKAGFSWRRYLWLQGCSVEFGSWGVRVWMRGCVDAFGRLSDEAHDGYLGWFGVDRHVDSRAGVLPNLT